MTGWYSPASELCPERYFSPFALLLYLVPPVKIEDEQGGAERSSLG